VTICIYHGNCADGFASAWVVRKAIGESVEFHAGVYQDPPPDVTGKRVLLVDFSYKRPIVEQMLEKTNGNVTILDHHKTAIEDLAGLPLHGTMNVDRSGAMLTWEYFFPGEAPPPLLLHIEDRDLWRFALARTREIQANVFSYPYDFQVWDELMAADVEDLAREGAAIERKHFKDIDELLGVVTRRMVIGGYNVPVANLPYTLTSDAGHKLAKGEAFGVCYWDTPEGRVFSLRSTDAGIDVSEVVKQYGGGGHRNAAGFRVGYATAAQFEVTTA